MGSGGTGNDSAGISIAPDVRRRQDGFGLACLSSPGATAKSRSDLHMDATPGQFGKLRSAPRNAASFGLTLVGDVRRPVQLAVRRSCHTPDRQSSRAAPTTFAYHILVLAYQGTGTRTHPPRRVSRPLSASSAFLNDATHGPPRKDPLRSRAPRFWTDVRKT